MTYEASEIDGRGSCHSCPVGAAAPPDEGEETIVGPARVACGRRVSPVSFFDHDIGETLESCKVDS